MTKKAILLLVTVCIIFAASAISAMAGTIEDDHSSLSEEIYPQNNVICMNERYLFRFCKICSVFIDVNTYKPIGHVWEQFNSIQPTCRVKGSVIYKCKNCEATENREVAPSYHKFPDSNWMSFEMWEKVDLKHADGPHSPLTLIDAHTGSGCKYKWYPVTCYANEHYDIYCANGCGTSKTLFKDDIPYLSYSYPDHKYYINNLEYLEKPVRTVINYKCSNSGCPYDVTVIYPGKLSLVEIPTQPIICD